MSWHPERPYNDLPPIPPVDRLESRAVLKATITARAALAELDQAARSMPNPTVLINTIPLLEAQASSEIENVVTTTDALFRHQDADDEAADPATRETLRYRTALRVGYESVGERALRAATAIQVCSTIKGREATIRALPGTRIANPVTREVIFSPPEGRDVIEQKLADWERFIHADDGVDPLVRMAAAHYQFEAIHPFADGNGRTGRILNILLLVEAGLLKFPVLFLSRYFIDSKDDYYRLLLEVTTSGAWEDWLTYVLRGVEVTSRSTLAKIAAIRDLQADYARRSREVMRSTGDAEFQSVLFEQPYARIATVVERCGVTRPTATAWLAALGEAGMLDDVKAGRDRLFVNRELLQLLASP